MYDGKISPDSVNEIESLCADMIAQHESAIATLAPFVNKYEYVHAHTQIGYHRHAIAAIRELRSQAKQRLRKD